MTRIRSWSTYWIVQIACWGGYAFVSVLALLPSTPTENVPRLLLVKGTRALLGLPLSHLLRLLYRREITRGAGIARLAADAVVGSTVLGPLWLVLSVEVMALLRGTVEPVDWVLLPHRSLDLSIALLGWSAAYFGWRQWRSAQASQREADDARVLATSAQLDALRYQLNPHFLFNALASIRGCVLEDQARARDMITRLSEVLRYALQDGTAPFVTLGDELRVVRDYLAIEETRFGAALRVSIDVEPEALHARIPSFLVHPLVENAIVHGRRTSAGTLDVSIRGATDGRHLSIVVTNSGALVDDADRRAASAGIGTRNVRARLEQLYGDGASFLLEHERGAVSATLHIPLAHDSQPAAALSASPRHSRAAAR